ncbi:MAG: ribonuclease P protein component [Lachnospiraceae bacterium]|nr:ribonuclease P protein component [Lachnospiraceae bacterium]
MERLKKTEDFGRVYKKGKSKADRNLVLFYLPTEEEERRLGISVSKKVGNSVVRHRTKRRLKEAARLNEDAFPKKGDFVILARNHAAFADYHELETSLLHLLERMKERQV